MTDPLASKSYAFLLTLLLACAACDSGTHPIAPVGTSMSVTANPASVALDGASQIRIELRGTTTGIPVRSGTEVRLATNLGQVEELVRTDRDGIAQATFQATGEAGMATVTVSSGAISMTTMITIEEGS